MRFSITRLHAWLAAGALAVLLGIGALASAASTGTRHSLLAQLQTPAIRARASSRGGVEMVRRFGARYSVVVSVTPNHARGQNGLSVRVAERGRSLTRARVTVVFSMPSMNMWHAYTSVLEPAGSGLYAAAVPVLGMAGRWQLSVVIAPPGGRTFRVTVADRMSA